MTGKKRLVIGISGASGVILGVRLLELLSSSQIETHLVISRAAEQALALETMTNSRTIEAIASASYPITDIGAAISSGSFKTDGMVVVPCSVKSLAEIASGVTSNLLTRAADVTLKERRRLVLLVRETPLHIGHLRNMITVTEMGGVVMPPVPAYYSHPTNFEDLINHTLGRALDLFDIDLGVVKRWNGTRSGL